MWASACDRLARDQPIWSESMPKFISLAGQRFGRWTVLQRGEGYVSPGGARQIRWLCRCDCGTERLVFGAALRTGNSISCGCYQKELPSNSFRHGLSNTPEYASWLGARSRCTNPEDRGWSRYGGRGIQMCDRWMDSFETFLADMGPKPGPMHTLDRIDGNKGYAPENCRWADKKQQARNRSDNRPVMYQGKRYLIVELAEELGMNWQTIASRIESGWPESRWADPVRASNRTVNYRGRRVRLIDLAPELGIHIRTLRIRVAAGVPEDQWGAKRIRLKAS